MPPSPDNPPVRRVVLPSGKEIEVMRFSAPALHVCRSCGGEHVQPVEWHEAGREHWEIDLRCPNCGWEDGGMYPQAAVEAFEEELDRATEALLADLNRMQRARMEEDVARFVAALAADQILPEDF